MEQNEIRIVENMINKALGEYARFQTKKVGDTPTDFYQLVPLSYSDAAFTTAKRPASVLSPGMSREFFNTSTGYPWFFNPNSSVWVSATGSVVASN